MNQAQREWMARQNTTSTGDAVRDYLIFQSISQRYFQEFPRARRLRCPETLDIWRDEWPAIAARTWRASGDA